MLWLALLLFANQFEGAFRAGLVALNNNDLVLAESQLESASKLQPRNARVWLALAQTYSKLHKLPAAQTAAKKAEALATEPAILEGLALYYSEAANYGKAAELEARFAETAPDALPRAVDLYLRAGKAKPAIDLARKSLQANDRAELRDLLGKAYEADGDVARAIPEFQAAIQKNRLDEDFYFDLAQAQLQQQNFPAALETLDTGRMYFDKSAQLELAAGVAYYGLRRFPEAIDAFLRTIPLDPTIERPYVFLGRMLDQAEDKLPKITEVFAAFAKSAPGNYLGSFLYGKALAVQDPAQAERLLRESIARNGQFWESHFELGALLEQRGAAEEAAQEIRRTIELNPQDPASHYRLARLYDRLGKTAEARAERELHAKLSAASPGIK
jgi:tetratricopeptide (TPR) repeat protein